MNHPVKKHSKIFLSVLIGLSLFYSSSGVFIKSSEALADINNKPLAAASSADPFSFIVLPDTQNYATLYPEIFTKQTQWIIDNKEALNIKYVAHLGDIIDSKVSPTKVPNSVQWENANTAMSLLDNAGMPFGVLAGNHDDMDGTNYSEYAQYFGESRFKNKPWFGQSYDADNKFHYDLINAGKYKFLILNISYDQAADLPLNWFKQVIEANSDKTVIITTHAYLDRPYTVIQSLDSVAVIRDLAMQYSNVKMVLSGHVSIKPEMAINNSIRKGTLRETLQDYQYGPNGGNGWLRIYTFDNNDNVTVKTYSPYLNQYGASFSFSLNSSSLASFWNFDENTGTAASDSSGHDNTGTINGATWTSGKIRKALNFDGVNDYIEIGDKFEYPEGTISMWFNRNTAFNSFTVNDEYIYNKNKNGSNAGDVTIAFNGSQNADGDGHITFSIDDQNSAGHNISSDSNNWPAGVWHYLTVTWGAPGMKMYIDGVLQQDTDAYSGGIPNNSLSLSIGGSHEQNNYFYNGKIDEVKIYNHALSGDEIAAEYKHGSAELTKPIVVISSHSNNQIVTASEITISGSTTDNTAVDRTDIRLNDDVWQTIPGLTSWSKTVALVPGANIIRAWANDIFGNHNTATINITYNPQYQETTKPSISITSLSNGQNFTIPTITVSGTAGDNVGLSRIDLKTNSGSWQLASGTTSWSKPITFKSGSNTIYARAIDKSGNIIEKSVNVTYTPVVITPTPLPTPTPTPTSTPIITPTPTPSPALTPTPTSTPIITLTPTPAPLYTSYPDSTLLKTSDSPKVYVIIQGKKKWISTPEVFETLGYQWTNITIVDQAALSAISDYEDNLIRAIGDYKVWLVTNGIRHHIPNPEIFLDYGFAWTDVKDVPQAIIDQYRLAKLIRESKQGKIYYLSATGIKKWIPTADIFNSYNNDWNDIQVISKKQMDSYLVSNLMKMANSSNVYLIQNTTKRLIPSIAVFNKYKYDWAMVLEANQMEFDWYKIGTNVK